jgi:DNA polymerase-3 subunit gamma/tau
VYIIDEAHMVTPQGFNALLKLVEEPPSHLRFIFATTEPDKVIGTIRSRTHHYPFRLVPPKLLGDYLLDLCGREGVSIEPTVVPLIVRAGAGSVRDSLSVLDQLIGGSGSEGVTYPLATALLGYTPDTLLDETVDALAADDGATLFGVIEKVVETGQDPRRFAEDLLQRLRDLVVVSAVPGAASRGLIEVSDDGAERLSGQAARFGRAELTRAADIVSQGLTDMRGATAPRLLLEMMCARILLPGLDSTVEGLGSRLDRIERRLSVVGDHSTLPSNPAPVTESAPAPVTVESSEPAATIDEPVPAVQDAPTAPSTEPVGGRLGLVDIRQLWPGVLDRVKQMRRYAWILLSQNAHVKDVGDSVITIGLSNAGARDSFTRSGADEILHQALIEELGVDWRVDAIIDGAGDQRQVAYSASEPPPPEESPPVRDQATSAAPVAGVEAAKEAIRATRPKPSGGGQSRREASTTAASDIDDDDHVIDDAAVSSQELLSRELGARVIEDIRHDPV